METCATNDTGHCHALALQEDLKEWSRVVGELIERLSIIFTELDLEDVRKSF